MTKETYEKITAAFRENPTKLKRLILADKILTKIAYIAYPLLLGILFLQKDGGLLRAVFADV